MLAISSYRGNRPTNLATNTQRPPARCTQTGPITIHGAAKLSAQCNYRKRRHYVITLTLKPSFGNFPSESTQNTRGYARVIAFFYMPTCLAYIYVLNTQTFWFFTCQQWRTCSRKNILDRSNFFRMLICDSAAAGRSANALITGHNWKCRRILLSPAAGAITCSQSCVWIAQSISAHPVVVTHSTCEWSATANDEGSNRR